MSLLIRCKLHTATHIRRVMFHNKNELNIPEHYRGRATEFVQCLLNVVTEGGFIQVPGALV